MQPTLHLAVNLINCTIQCMFLQILMQIKNFYFFKFKGEIKKSEK